MSRIGRGKGIFRAYGRVGKAPPLPPPPAPVPPPSKHLLLKDDCSNLPPRWSPLPNCITYKGFTTEEWDCVQLVMRHAQTQSDGSSNNPHGHLVHPGRHPLKRQGEPLAPPTKTSESLPGDRVPCAVVPDGRSPEAPDAAAAGVPDGRAQVKESQRGSLTGVGAPSCVRSIPSEQDSWWELSVHAGLPEGKMSCPETLPDLHGCGEATVAQK